MRYRKVHGTVKYAEFTREPEWAKRKRRVRGAKRRGVKYEAKVQQHLAGLYGDNYIPSPWMQFIDDRGKLKYCQPDGLLIWPHKGLITIVEVKYQHTQAAWLQLHELYLPVTSKLFETSEGLWQIGMLEVVKWYDPLIKYPNRPDLCKDPEQIRPNQYGLHICQP